jgi:hypothetical protein
MRAYYIFTLILGMLSVLIGIAQLAVALLMLNK